MITESSPNSQKRRSIGVIQGDYSREFLDKMGYKKWDPPLVKISDKTPVIPLEPIKLYYPKVDL